MIVVDSSVWISYFSGHDSWQTKLLHERLDRETIVMGDLILTEVLQGFRSEKDFHTAKKLLELLPFRAMGGFSVALQSAHHYRFLQKKGLTVRKTIDVIIGTFCILEELPLLHDDKDFEPMELHLGLKTFHQ